VNEATGFVTAWLALFACASLQTCHHDLLKPDLPDLVSFAGSFSF
jgi:hypothetical protein